MTELLYLDCEVRMGSLREITCETNLKQPCGIWGEEEYRIIEEWQVQRSCDRNGQSMLTNRKRISSSW